MKKKEFLIVIKWLAKRFIYIKKELRYLIDRLIYQKSSFYLPHKYNAHKCPYQSMLYFNLFGRVLFASKEFIALLSNNRVFKKSIVLEGFEKIDFKECYKEGCDDILYPKSPFIDGSLQAIENSFFEKIERSLQLALQNDQKLDRYNPTWQKAKKEFLTFLLDKNQKIIPTRVINFRKDAHFEKIITDQFTYVDQKNSYFQEYLKAIDLILEYHRYANIIQKEILANMSESSAGNNSCVVYRGKRVSEKELFYALCINNIYNHCKFHTNRLVVCDIGAGYGGLIRELKYYLDSNSCYILIDLPEVIVFAAYFIKYNFKDAKIALLEDIIHKKENFESLINRYDFIILPPSHMDIIGDDNIDLVINTASLSFMSESDLDSYLSFISRTLKKDGYFYSVNTTDGTQFGGKGTYKWDYKDEYLTIHQGFSNRFAYPEWLGKKLS